jgi:hypothetical protein
MANTIRLKRASGSDPGASDLVTGELAVRTDNGKLFTKKDDGSVAEISGGGGIDDGDKGDITVSNSGATFTIDNQVVTTAKLANDAVTQNKIADDSVGTAQLVNGGVSSVKIGSDAITGAKIADDSIDSEHYVDGSIDTAHIADDQVTYAKIQNVSATDRILGRDSSGAGVIEEITPANLRTMINVEDGATADQSASEIVALIADQTIAPSTIDMEDDERIKLGASDDLLIYHDTNSFVRDVGGGDLFVDTNGTKISLIADGTSSKTMANFNKEGAVELYHNTNKKFETSSSGIHVTGDVSITGDYLADDDEKLKMGDGFDLQIYHDGSNSYVQDTGTGNLKLLGSTVQIGKSDNSEIGLTFTSDGSIQLRHDNSTKFETSSSGVSITGTISSTDSLTITNENPEINLVDSGGNPDYRLRNQDGTFRITDTTNNAGRFVINSDGHIDVVGNLDVGAGLDVTGNITATGTIASNNITITDGAPKISFVDTNNNDDFAIKVNSGSFKIVDTTDDNDRFAIDSSGNITATGTFTTGSHVITGNITVSGTVDGRDVASDGSKLDGIAAGATNVTNNNQLTNGAGYITSSSAGIPASGGTFTGDISVSGGANALKVNANSDIRFVNGNWTGNPGSTGKIQMHSNRLYIVGGTDGIMLREDGNDRIHMDGSGNFVPQGNNLYSLGNASNRWSNIFTNDLHLSNKGGANKIDNSWGDFTIQEGSEDLYLINNRNGKMFKFVLQEVG